MGNNHKNLMALALMAWLIAGFVNPPPLGAAEKSSEPKKEKHADKLKKNKILFPLWSHALKSGTSKKAYFPEMASPEYFQDRVFVGTHSGLFYAFSANRSKKPLWVFDSEGPIASQALARADAVYFGNNKGMVFALDSATGRPLWKVYVGGEVLSRPAIIGSTLYVVTTSRELYALDAASGNERWSSFIKGFENKITMRGNASIVGEAGHLYVGLADGQLVALNAESGSVRWSRDLLERQAVFKDIDAAVVLDGRTLYAVGYFGFLFKLDKATGQTVWRKEVQSGTNIGFSGDQLYLSTAEGRVVALDKGSGVRQWETPLKSGTLSSPLVVGRYVLVGSQSGNAFVLDKASGKVLQTMALGDGYLSDAIGDHGRVYILSNSAKLHALGLNLN